MIPQAYDTLEHRTRATIADFPFYADRQAMILHAQYMLFSTRHWLPMVNGYSDVIPADFREAAPALDSFPSREAFAVLAKRLGWDSTREREAIDRFEASVRDELVMLDRALAAH